MSTALSITRSATGSSTTLTVGTAAPAGRRLLAWCLHSNSGTDAIIDSKGNTWTEITGAYGVTTSSPILPLRVFTTAQDAGALTATDTVKVTHSQSGSYGLLGLIIPDQNIGAVDSGTSAIEEDLSSTAVTPVTVSGANRQAYVVTAWYNTDQTFTAPTGYTAIGGLAVAGSRIVAVFEDKDVDASGTVSTPLPSSSWVQSVITLPVNAATGGGSGGGGVTHVWSGIPGTIDQKIKTRTTGGGFVRLQVTPVNASGTPTGAAASYTPLVVPDADGYALHTITGLTSNTSYSALPEVGGALASSTWASVFTTSYGSFLPGWSFAFASCLDSGDTRRAAFDHAMSRKPALFFHLGDWDYDDNLSTSTVSQRQSLEAQIAGNAGLRDIIHKVPTAYIKSDHDSGDNDWSGGPGPQTPAVNAAYRQVVPDAPVGTAGNYWTKAYNGVRFIFTDGRSFKSSNSATDDANKTMFGPTQKQWIKDTAMAAEEKYIVLVLELPWVYPKTAGDDKWGGFTTERSELANFFVNNNLKVMIIHGDQHSLAADNGANSVGHIPVMGAAPLSKTTSIKGGPYSQGTWPTSANIGSVEQQMGIVYVNSTAATSTTQAGANFVFNGIGSDDTTRITMTTTFVDPIASSGGGTGGGTTTAPTGAVRVAASNIITQAASDTSLTIPLPAVGTGLNQWTYDAAKSQTLFIICGLPTQTTAPSAPAGFTSVVPEVRSGNGSYLGVYKRALTAADAGASVTVPLTGSASDRCGAALVVEGIASALDGSPFMKASTSTTPTSGPLSLVSSPAFVLNAMQANTVSGTGDPAGFTVVTAGDASTPDTYSDGYVGRQVVTHASNAHNRALLVTWKVIPSGTGVPIVTNPSASNVYYCTAMAAFAASVPASGGTTTGGGTAPTTTLARPFEMLTTNGDWVSAALEYRGANGQWH